MDTTHGPGPGRMGEPEEPHGVSVPMPHHKVPYVACFLALIVLTVLTVAVALKRFDNEVVNLLIALLIASIKASLVALFFMHLKFEGKLIYLILIVPLCLCVLLICALIPDIVYAMPFDRMAEHPGHLPGQHLPGGGPN
ncbi:MAG TPA: cytochrome C oxidase subunit IV family protein [Tepidisphaeraceae bacterium]|nr:cytochrome C oxidase subunit IV family protein [Tepidisphaeraceae bacterium]